MKYNWTTREVDLVRQHYPNGGVEACIPHVQRSRQSIYQRANALGLRAPGQTGVRESWPNDPELDGKIRRLHERPLGRGAITEFAESIHRPKWYVSRRARELGLKTPRFKELPWTDAEIQILHDTASFGTAAARRRLASAGFERSETSIHVKRKRVGISTVQARQDSGMFTANQLSEMLGVDGKTPSMWIRRGELKASRRNTDRTEVQGGDMWNIRESDLREFIITHPLRIELRKIPDAWRVWFIELLAGRAGIPVERAA